MPFIKFKNFIENKKQVPVDQVPDYNGSIPTSPSKEKMHKDAGGKGQVGNPHPYKHGKDAANPNKSEDFHKEKSKEKMPDGMYGGKGGVSKSVNGVPGGKEIKGWTKTQEWIEKTKNMPLSEFTKNLIEENECVGSSYKSIQSLVEACKCNIKNISNLVHEMKRKGVLKDLVSEAMNHEESYEAIGLALLEERNARKLDNVLKEMVAPPVGSEEEDVPSPMADKKYGDEDDMNPDEEDDMDSDEYEMDLDMGPDEDEMDSDEDEMDLDMDSDEDEMDLDMDSDEDEMDLDMDSDEDEMDLDMDSDEDEMDDQNYERKF